ncbi:MULTISPECIES: protein kinase [Rhodopirellula]|uniref:protein kinase n=1 Tax=Rhodopirellula TaxID=265488 RepID=UPI0030EE642D
MLDSVSQYRRRTRLTAYAVAALIAVLAVLLNLPWRYTQISERWMGEPFTLVQRVPALEADQITRAGWPWRYQVLVDEGPDGISQQSTSNVLAARSLANNAPQYWSGWALLADLAFACMLVGLTFRLWCWRGERIAVSETPERTRRKFDIAVASACFLLPAVLVFASNWTAKAQLASIESSTSRGGYQFTFEAPRFLKKRIPEQLHPCFLRLRTLELYSPTEDRLNSLIGTKTLRSVLITDGRLRSHTLDPLRNATELTSLTLNRSPVSNEICEDIRACKRLMFLSLNQCNLTSQMATPINEMDKLQYVDLRRNPLKLDTISKPEWSTTCRSLVLSRPEPGESAHLNLYQWPSLERLSIRSSIRIHNDAPLKLTLTNLPSLTEIELDRSQKHSLHAKNLPRFRRILEPIDLMLLYGRNDQLQGLTRFESVDLHDVPNLRRLQCHAADLKELRLSDVGRLKEFYLGVYSYDSQGQVTTNSQTVVGNEAWLKQIAQVPSLTKVDLASVQFRPESLEQLATLSYLKQLSIQQCGLKYTDLDWVLSLEKLQSLGIRDCRISAEWLQNCLAKLPRLRMVQADLSDLDQLTIAENPNLVSLDHFEVSKMNRLELRSLPRLRGSIQIRGEIKDVRLVDLPLLDELLIESPWPRQANLEGLTNLRYFGGGGPELNDDVIDQLLQFKQLDHIVLAYPNVSVDRLEALGQYKYLTGLEIPGCRVDDEVTSHWTKLLRLRVANFDDTQVSLQTFEWLHAIPSLRRLSLARVPLSADSRRMVSTLYQLSSLNLSGCDFPAEDLQRLLAAGNLEALDLTGCKLNESHLDTLANSQSLRRVVLKDCSLEPKQIADLLRVNPRLTLDLGVHDQTFFVNFAPPFHTRLIGCRVRKRPSPMPKVSTSDYLTSMGSMYLDDSAFPNDLSEDVVAEDDTPDVNLVSDSSNNEDDQPKDVVVDLAEFRMQSERAFSTELFRAADELTAQK